MAKFTKVERPTVINLGYHEPKRKELPGKGYCHCCGIYSPLAKRDLESGTCKYCRPMCKGSLEWPPANNVSGKFAICDFCGARVTLNADGRMGKHVVYGKVVTR